jgi:hypothetical protein
MTIVECKEAIFYADEIKKYKACLKNNKDRNCINTIGIETGRGEEQISISVPWTYIEQIIEKRIEHLSTKLRIFGITVDD